MSSSETVEGDIVRFFFPKTEAERRGSVFIIAQLSDGTKIKGNMVDPLLYQTYKFTGEIEASEKWGDTFVVDTAKVLMPKSTDGIRDYLCTVHNIGAVRADALVKAYGEETLDVLCEKPAQDICDEVNKTLSPKVPLEVFEGLVQKVQGQKSYSKIFVNLKKLFRNMNVGNRALNRIINRWKEETVKVLKENPYLLTQIRGIGFKTADRVALRLKYPRDGEFRILHAVEYVLGEVTNQGHTFAKQTVVTQEVVELIGQPRQRIDVIIGGLAEDDPVITRFKFVVDDPAYKGWLLALTTLHQQEQMCARLVSNLLNATAQEGNPDTVGLKEDQKRAISMVVKNTFSILTGSPGTGKTYTIQRILSSFPRANVLLCAPTGKAAVRVTEQTGKPAQTIHRALQAIPREDGFDFNHCSANPLPHNLVIVDEVSMVDTALFFHLLSAIRPGTRVVLVGDAHQLPSVGPGSVLRDLLASGVVPHTELDIIKRQADNLLARNLKEIKDGKEIDYDSELWNETDFTMVDEETPEAIEATILEILDEIAHHPEWSKQVICPHRAEKYKLSTDLVNRAVLRHQGKETPDDRPVPFNRGDKVVQTRNDYDLEIFNGDIGIVAKANQDKSLEVMFEDYEKSAQSDDKVYKTVKITLAQNDLTHAYALTVHKFQGSEAATVIIPMHESFSRNLMHRNLVYTAMSRAKTHCIVVGQRSALEKAIGRTETDRRKTLLSYKLDDFVEVV